jgi:hypothetical protein
VEGSPELLASVKTRLDGDGAETPDTAGAIHVKESVPPHVFLSYAWEDRELAGQIARALQGNGIETFWAEWSMGPGDSLVQKINEGQLACFRMPY